MPVNLTPSNNMSHSLLIRPQVRFEIQRPGEEVVLVIRKHPLTQIPWIFNTAVFIILTVFLNFFLPNFLTDNEVFVINLFAFSFIFSYVFLNFLFWYFTIGIVSNERVLDLDFFNILYKEFSATDISDVSELTTSVGGFFGSLFDFGDVFVKTQGFSQNIEFDDVPQPATIVKIINELKIENEDT